MARCDRLEASLDKSTAIRRLLDALFDVALKATDTREVAAA